MENALLEVLKTQGIAVFLIVVAIVIVWVWILPEWKRQAGVREKQEETRQQIMGEHMNKLTQEIHDERREHREERAQVMAGHTQERKEQEERHREDMREQRKLFSEMIENVHSSLRGLSREVSRNTAITLASAVEVGGDKQSIKDRAARLQSGDTGEIESIQERTRR